MMASVPASRAHRAAGDGRVEVGRAALGKGRRMLARLRRADRAHVDQQRAPRQGIGHAPREQHLVHRLAVLEHRDRHLGPAHRLGRRIGDERAAGRKRLGARARAIPHGHVVAGAAQPARHRRAHQAGAEQGDLHACISGRIEGEVSIGSHDAAAFCGAPTRSTAATTIRPALAPQFGASPILALRSNGGVQIRPSIPRQTVHASCSHQSPARRRARRLAGQPTAGPLRAAASCSARAAAACSGRPTRPAARRST
jgi:hypothetical protein